MGLLLFVTGIIALVFYKEKYIFFKLLSLLYLCFYMIEFVFFRFFLFAAYILCGKHVVGTAAHSCPLAVRPVNLGEVSEQLNPIER